MDTVAQLLCFGDASLCGSSETPRLDAEVLLMHVLRRDRAWLRTWPEQRLAPAAAERFQSLLEQRRAGIPIAYLTGEREFWSRGFAVRPGVLIPRPETELLVELALDRIAPDRPARILDLGAGSGILAVTLALERPLARVTAIDLSPEALEVARENAARHRVGNLLLVRGDWLESIVPARCFDLIVSNPPYIAEADPHLRQGDLRFEPAFALQSGSDGLDALRRITDTARPRLRPGGLLLLEHGYDQAGALRGILDGFGYADIVHHPDLQGHPRATRAVYP